MENKIFFLLTLIGSIILFLGIIIALILLLMERKADWSDYDSYILSLFWGPGVCFNAEQNKEKCFDQLDKLNINKSFIIHGLWPTYASGDLFDNCNQDDEIKLNFDKEYEKNLSKIWPGLNLSDNERWSKEYNNHGYCYIKRSRNSPEKNYKKYFDKTTEMFTKKLEYIQLMDHILPDTPQGLNKFNKEKFKYFLYDSTFNLDPSTYSLRCEENKETNSMMLNEIWFKYDFDFNKTSSIQLFDNCPERFDIYFRDKNNIPVWKKYEFYIMAVLWPVSYCLEQGKECYKKLKQKELNIMTIHGLRPSYSRDVIPQWCNLDTNVEINTFTKEMEDYWINIYKKNNKEFWTYQYNRHGYCYNQRMNKSTDNYMLYFNKTTELYANISNIINKTISLKDLLKTYIYPDIIPGKNYVNKTYLHNKLGEIFDNGTFTLTCITHKGQFYLHEIGINFDLNFIRINNGSKMDNCSENFYIEFLKEDEGERKQAIGFSEAYDMYFYTILWHGTTCQQKGWYCHKKMEQAGILNLFTIHGLWPSYRNGTIIQEYCYGKNDIEIEIKDKSFLDFMNKYYVSGHYSNEDFWAHEYNKHGYCFNQKLKYDVNNYELFFIKIKNMFVENKFENLFLDFFEKENITIKTGDMAINRTKFEKYFEKRGFPKDYYLIVCTNITNKNNIINPHISEIRIRYDLDFKLLKNETDKCEFDCPEIFYAQFYGNQEKSGVKL